MFKKFIIATLFTFSLSSFAYAKPWLNPDEQDTLRDLINRNEASDIIGTGQEGPNKWGKQWWLMLVFQRASTGVSFRDTTHGIFEPIAICQSAPYRIFNYVDESSIPFGIPAFPKNRGSIPFYFEKSDKTLGKYADLYWLSPDGYIRNDQGMISDTAKVSVYASKNHMSVSQVFSDAKLKMISNYMMGEDRILSKKEVLPLD